MTSYYGMRDERETTSMDARRRKGTSSGAAILVLVLAWTSTAPALSSESETLAWHLEDGRRDVSQRRASKQCAKSKAEGNSDWRLPAEPELWELATRAQAGDTVAAEVIESLEGNAAWSRDVSSSELAWAASYRHGYLFRIHVANERALRALCVRGREPENVGNLEEGDWLRPLGGATKSTLTWPCEGELRKPVPVAGSLAPFRRALPPGPLGEEVSVDFVVDEDGWVLYAGPSPETPSRYGALAVETLKTFRFDPATCDERPTAVFYHLDFEGRGVGRAPRQMYPNTGGKTITTTAAQAA